MSWVVKCQGPVGQMQKLKQTITLLHKVPRLDILSHILECGRMTLTVSNIHQGFRPVVFHRRDHLTVHVGSSGLLRAHHGQKLPVGREEQMGRSDGESTQLYISITCYCAIKYLTIWYSHIYWINFSPPIGDTIMIDQTRVFPLI